MTTAQRYQFELWAANNPRTATEAGTLALLAEVDRLRAENERLQQDAKRLDWLERHGCDVSCDRWGNTVVANATGRIRGVALFLRAAIDDAIDDAAKAPTDSGVTPVTDTPGVVIQGGDVRAIIRPDVIPDPYLPENRARLRLPDSSETTIDGFTVDADGNACRVLLKPTE